MDFHINKKATLPILKMELIKDSTEVRKMGVISIEAHNSVMVWGKIASNDTLNLTECLPRF